eukprot:CAMPEP_0183738544 /NCGR_PEP_ID=MMETSP0737-20130205/54870_1 /TAXON_ID=385413 /ORGANISM="Thalassiosira miniscula, Strain CCMP1093" /LENGTH=1166 /DNA_ID=CAMNT_0025973101 /DNA_START=13 /DNA_END=3513 /DNA_ORIENTATION=+
MLQQANKYQPAYPSASYDTQGFCLIHPMIRVCPAASLPRSGSKLSTGTDPTDSLSGDAVVAECPLCNPSKGAGITSGNNHHRPKTTTISPSARGRPSTRVGRGTPSGLFYNPESARDRKGVSKDSIIKGEQTRQRQRRKEGDKTSWGNMRQRNFHARKEIRSSGLTKGRGRSISLDRKKYHSESDGDGNTRTTGSRPSGSYGRNRSRSGSNTPNTNRHTQNNARSRSASNSRTSNVDRSGASSPAGSFDRKKNHSESDGEGGNTRTTGGRLSGSYARKSRSGSNNTSSRHHTQNSTRSRSVSNSRASKNNGRTSPATFGADSMGGGALSPVQDTRRSRSASFGRAREPLGTNSQARDGRLADVKRTSGGSNPRVRERSTSQTSRYSRRGGPSIGKTERGMDSDNDDKNYKGSSNTRRGRSRSNNTTQSHRKRALTDEGLGRKTPSPSPPIGERTASEDNLKYIQGIERQIEEIAGEGNINNNNNKGSSDGDRVRSRSQDVALSSNKTNRGRSRSNNTTRTARASSRRSKIRVAPPPPSPPPARSRSRDTAVTIGGITMDRQTKTSEETSKLIEDIERQCLEISKQNLQNVQIVVPNHHPTNLKEKGKLSEGYSPKERDVSMERRAKTPPPPPSTTNKTLSARREDEPLIIRKHSQGSFSATEPPSPTISKGILKEQGMRSSSRPKKPINPRERDVSPTINRSSSNFHSPKKAPTLNSESIRKEGEVQRSDSQGSSSSLKINVIRGAQKHQVLSLLGVSDVPPPPPEKSLSSPSLVALAKNAGDVSAPVEEEASKRKTHGGISRVGAVLNSTKEIINSEEKHSENTHSGEEKDVDFRSRRRRPSSRLSSLKGEPLSSSFSSEEKRNRGSSNRPSGTTRTRHKQIGWQEEEKQYEENNKSLFQAGECKLERQLATSSKRMERLKSLRADRAMERMKRRSRGASSRESTLESTTLNGSKESSLYPASNEESRGNTARYSRDSNGKYSRDSTARYTSKTRESSHTAKYSSSQRTRQSSSHKHSSASVDNERRTEDVRARRMERMARRHSAADISGNRELSRESHRTSRSARYLSSSGGGKGRSSPHNNPLRESEDDEAHSADTPSRRMERLSRQHRTRRESSRESLRSMQNAHNSFSFEDGGQRSPLNNKVLYASDNEATRRRRSMKRGI